MEHGVGVAGGGRERESLPPMSLGALLFHVFSIDVPCNDILARLLGSPTKRGEKKSGLRLGRQSSFSKRNIHTRKT
jgi:hypothetical protein